MNDDQTTPIPASSPVTAEPVPAVPVTPEPVTPEPAAAEPLPAVRPASRRSGGGGLLNLALAGALVLAIGGVAFAAGRATAPAPITAGNGNGNGGQLPFPSGGFVGNGNGRPGDGQGGPGGIFAGSGPTIEGTVESVTATTLTLKTADGQTIQIALDSGTAYHAQTDATAADVKTGSKVQVRLDFRGQGGGANGAGSPANDVTVVP